MTTSITPDLLVSLVIGFVALVILVISGLDNDAPRGRSM